MTRAPLIRKAVARCECGVGFSVMVGPEPYVKDVSRRPSDDAWTVRCVCGRDMTITVGEVRRDAA